LHIPHLHDQYAIKNHFKTRLSYLPWIKETNRYERYFLLFIKLINKLQALFLVVESRHLTIFNIIPTFLFLQGQYLN